MEVLFMPVIFRWLRDPVALNDYFKAVDLLYFIPSTSMCHHGHPQLQPPASALHPD
jgi:hypothetical protein